MSQIFQPGQNVLCETTGWKSQVHDYLGGGGQGEVYTAVMGSQQLALKWYFPDQATPDQHSILKNLISIGPPTEQFLWPMDLAHHTTIPGFGYLMPLRPSSYKGIVDLMKRRIDPSFRSVITAGIQLVHSFYQLHAKGLCYRDISFGNVFFHPDHGDTLICDNDNVGVDGKTQTGVLGTPRFMAPEVVRGEAPPNTDTDLYSLAVLLFYLLLIHHPLEGKQESLIKCMDKPAMDKLYGFDPVFVFDPVNDSNRPVPGLHDNALIFWPIYPRFLQKLFTESFTRGITDPQHGRVRETVWRSNLIALRDALLYCPFCGSENFFDQDTYTAQGRLDPCWSCQKTIILPPRLHLEKNLVILNHDTQLYPHHLNENQSYDFSAPQAEVTRHPQNPNRWGLKNLSTAKWVLTTPEGKVTDIEPNRTVPLKAGNRILFETRQGEIVV